MDAIPTSPSLDVPPTTGRIVVLNGFSGTGKLTILEQAEEPALPTRLSSWKNHLLIDPVIALIPGRSDEHELRREIRPIFKELGERAQEGYVILMTAYLAEDNERDSASTWRHRHIRHLGECAL